MLFEREVLQDILELKKRTLTLDDLTNIISRRTKIIIVIARLIQLLAREGYIKPLSSGVFEVDEEKIKQRLKVYEKRN
jgi:hypothetical protein